MPLQGGANFIKLCRKLSSRVRHTPDVVAHMTHAGVSNRQFARTIQEVRQIVVAHGRNPLLAGIEARARLLKTSAAQPIKRKFYPLYSFVRRTINRSYSPAE